MDEELKTYLDSRFSEMESRPDSVRKELHNELLVVRSELERGETRLLTEFWKSGRSSDTRTRRVEMSDTTTVERLATIEERIFALERRVLGSKE